MWIAILVVAGLWILVQFAGRNPPDGLGPTDAGLAECPDTPNCICSDCEGPKKMAPLKFEGEGATAQESLKAALAKHGIPIVREAPNYIHAVATTPLMRFKDDLEFLIVPDQKVIHFRSASRLGKSDLGKNRSRMEAIIKTLGARGIRVETAAP